MQCLCKRVPALLFCARFVLQPEQVVGGNVKKACKLCNRLFFSRGVFWFSSSLPFIIFGLLCCAAEIVGAILFSVYKSARDTYINAAWAARIGAEQK